MPHIPTALILTATITPPAGAAQLARTDPTQRLRDYEQALGFYLTLLARNELDVLVFADNSNSDTRTLHDMVNASGLSDRVEIMAFEGLDHPASYGRGYGEFKLIDHVMQHSQLIAKLPAQVRIWKVTGRYIVRNLAKLLRSMPAAADLYCHCRNYPQRWIDLYVLGWTHKGYQQFLKGIYSALREDESRLSAEHHFRRALDAAGKNLAIQPRFRVTCELEGHRGVDNRSYAEDANKRRLRQLAAVLLPWWWI